MSKKPDDYDIPYLCLSFQLNPPENMSLELGQFLVSRQRLIIGELIWVEVLEQRPGVPSL